MPDTPNFGWTYPDNNGSANVWGAILNTLFGDIDTDLKTYADLATAAMPATGGVFTGDVEYAAGSRLFEDDSNMAALDADWADGNFFTKSLSPGGQTITFSSPPTNGKVQFITLLLTQDGAGSATVTWDGFSSNGVEWQNGIAPTLSTTAAGQDVFTFFTRDGGTTVYGAHAITDPS